MRAAPIVAASLRYDPPNWGKSRPFFEAGATLSPYIDATYTRYYTNGLTPAQGVGSAVDRSVSVFGRVGWVDRVTPVDEAAVFADLVRGWQQSGGYTEAASAFNPFPATVSTGVDRQDVVRFGAQYTHLLFGKLEANINGAIAYGFDNKFGSQVSCRRFRIGCAVPAAQLRLDRVWRAPRLSILAKSGGGRLPDWHAWRRASAQRSTEAWACATLSDRARAADR